MKTSSRQTLCDFCFSQIGSNNKKCPHCDGKSNIEKHPTALKEGKILAGKYLVGKVLGVGGFGITYLCYDLKNEKCVAIGDQRLHGEDRRGRKRRDSEVAASVQERDPQPSH